MRRLQIAGGVAAVIAASWLLMFPVSDTQTYTRPGVKFASAPEHEASIIFGGDMIFDRSIRVAMKKNGDDFVFSCIDDLLQSVDLVVANLEGPITPHRSKSVGSNIGEAGNTTFTFATSTAELLARHNIRVVSLGNNHIMNFGREGLAETKQWLDAADVRYFGDPDLPEEERVERFSLNGIDFSFVNWSDWTSDKTDHTVLQVRKEAEAGRVVVVYTHWGEEYVSPLPRVKQLAHSFIDAGAAIVVGSHPHIVQERELYNNKYIYYSLGNFIFDQYWNESVRRGLLLRVEFSPAGVGSIQEVPIDNQPDRRPCVV